MYISSRVCLVQMGIITNWRELLPVPGVITPVTSRARSHRTLMGPPLMLSPGPWTLPLALP